MPHQVRHGVIESMLSIIQVNIIVFILLRQASTRTPHVAEEAPGGAFAGDLLWVETVDEHAFLGAVELFDKRARLVGDEGRSVIALAVFRADAVGGGDGDDVGGRMALLRAAPAIAGVERSIVRLAADGGGVKEDIRAE